MNTQPDTRLWAARLLIALVIAWNLQAALVFLLSPGAFAPGFELTGLAGEAAVRGIAVLFVMWNVPYCLALWHPRRNLLSLKEALAMQFIGLIGESFIFATLSPEHALLQSSILRFVAFDAAGLAMLGLAFWLARKPD
jgi:hypothetical protein